MAMADGTDRVYSAQYGEIWRCGADREKRFACAGWARARRVAPPSSGNGSRSSSTRAPTLRRRPWAAPLHTVCQVRGSLSTGGRVWQAERLAMPHPARSTSRAKENEPGWADFLELHLPTCVMTASELLACWSFYTEVTLASRGTPQPA